MKEWIFWLGYGKHQLALLFLRSIFQMNSLLNWWDYGCPYFLLFPISFTKKFDQNYIDLIPLPNKRNG